MSSFFYLKFVISIKQHVEMDNVYQDRDFAMVKLIVTMEVTKIVVEVRICLKLFILFKLQFLS